MLTTEKTRGIITFNEKEYSFLIDNNILHILPGSQIQQQDFKNWILNNFIKQWDGEIKFVPTKILKGITDSEENIEILVSDKVNNFNGFLSYKVIAYMKLNKKESIEKINKIRLTDDLLKYCIPPNDYQQAFIKYTGIERVVHRSIEYPLDKNLGADLGSFNFEKNKISVRSNVLLNINKNLFVPLSSKVYIDFCLEKASDFNKLLNLIRIINTSFKFIYRNTNSIFDSFILYNDNNKCGEIKLTDKLLIDQENICAINLKFLGTSYTRILQEIGDNHFTINHIPGNKPNSYTPSRQIDIFEAFESEFSMYPESQTPIRSEEFLTIRDEISTLIKEKIDKNTGHKKRCYKDLLTSINFTGCYC